MKQILQDVRSGVTAVKEIPDPLALPGQVLLAEISSAISAGTERYVVDLARKSLSGKPASALRTLNASCRRCAPKASAPRSPRFRPN